MIAATPIIMALMSGVESDDDLVRWLTGQPLQFIIALRGMMIGGAGLILVGVVLQTQPS